MQRNIFIKKNLLIFMFFTSFSAFADNSKISVIHIGNSCAPWDGHAISFHFKDDSVPHKLINISIWKWNPLFPFQTKFDFNPRTDIGNMNVCLVQNDKQNCSLQTGFLLLNSPYKTFKSGDIVEGKVRIENPESFDFHFKYTIPKEKNTQPIFCG